MKFADYEWTPIEKVPAKPAPTEPTPNGAPVVVPPKPTLPTMKIVPKPISADELIKNLESYYAEMQKVPNWEELLAEENRKIGGDRTHDPF